VNDLYAKKILDHGMNPRNWGILNPADLEFEGNYPLCGDRLRLMLRLDEDERVTAVAWDGEGCAISQASASILGEAMMGMTLDEVKQIDKQALFDRLEVPVPPNRVRCALLSLQTLTGAVYGPGQWYEHDE
jgi:nitrogen fixation NifU-like protein